MADTMDTMEPAAPVRRGPRRHLPKGEDAAQAYITCVKQAAACGTSADGQGTERILRAAGKTWADFARNIQEARRGEYPPKPIPTREEEEEQRRALTQQYADI